MLTSQRKSTSRRPRSSCSTLLSPVYYQPYILRLARQGYPSIPRILALYRENQVPYSYTLHLPSTSTPTGSELDCRLILFSPDRFTRVIKLTQIINGLLRLKPQVVDPCMDSRCQSRARTHTPRKYINMYMNILYLYIFFHVF